MIEIAEDAEEERDGRDVAEQMQFPFKAPGPERENDEREMRSGGGGEAFDFGQPSKREKKH